MNIDTTVFYFFNHLPHARLLDEAALVVHYLTRAGLLYYPLILLAIFLGNKHWQTFAKLVTIAMMATYALNDLIIKNIFNRARPFQELTNVYYIPPAPNNYSFPSGQTAVAFAIATMFFLMFPKSKLNFAFSAFALLVALDRVYMGHHFPSDILAGAAMGTLLSWLTFRYLSQKIKV